MKEQILPKHCSSGVSSSVIFQENSNKQLTLCSGKIHIPYAEDTQVSELSCFPRVSCNSQLNPSLLSSWEPTQYLVRKDTAFFKIHFTSPFLVAISFFQTRTCNGEHVGKTESTAGIAHMCMLLICPFATAEDTWGRTSHLCTCTPHSPPVCYHFLILFVHKKRHSGACFCYRKIIKTNTQGIGYY